MVERDAKIVTTLLGHKARCFDVRSNPSNHSQILTSSEDGYIRLWDMNKKSTVKALHHNKDAEVLRAAFVSESCIVSAGSDGVVKVWNNNDSLDSSASNNGVADESSSARAVTSQSNFTHATSLDHGGAEHQVYVCEPDKNVSTTSSRQLLTGVENKLLLWDLTTFDRIHEWDYYDEREEVFGGIQRNPNRHNYVFDAKWHPLDSNQAVVALSDCTLSMVDFRVPKVEHISINLQEDDMNLGHPTAVHWSLCGTVCYVSYGSGYVVLVDIRKGTSLGVVQLHSKPCYGLATQNQNLVSWSSDGLIRIWEASVDQHGELDECIIHQSLRLNDFSLLSCCVVPETSLLACVGSFANEKQKGNAFLGTPVYIVDTSVVTANEKNNQK